MTYAAVDEEIAENTHPAHLKSRILDEEERIRHKKLVRRLTIFALCVLCTLLAGVVTLLVIVLVRERLTALLVGCGIFMLVLLLGLWRLYRLYLQIHARELHLRKLHQVRRENLLADTQETGEDDGDDERRKLLAIHKRYREEVLDVIHSYREESSFYRRWHNIFQVIIIVGSIVTSTVTTASIPIPGLRWIAVGVSIVVGLAAGFTGYFKYRERSFNLQQTADSIERQYHSVELRVGRYRNKSEAEAYADFAYEVEYLREEQSKRQQQLEQPPDTKSETSI